MATRLKIPLILLIFTFFLLFTCSADSWLRINYNHIDSSWFFMGGKAWMNGMTPYVDFTDSKGPLLWLIYGLGYLLSPHSFYGVFWIEVLFYWGTFWFLYKTGALLLRSSSKGLLAALISSVFFFIPGIHYEIRAEDFCQLFFAIVFYVLCCVCVERKLSGRLSYLTGLSLGAALMIKYNIAGMLGVPVIFILIQGARCLSGREFMSAILYGICGFLTVVVPFMVYLISLGAFSFFINEYFINTFKTVGTLHGSPGELPNDSQIGFWFLLRTKGLLGIVYKLALVFVAYLPLRVYSTNFLRMAIWVSFIAVSMVVTNIVHEYYMNSLAVFFFLGTVSLVSFFKTPTVPVSLLFGGLAIACIVVAQDELVGKGEFSDPKRAAVLNAQYDEINSVLTAYRLRTGKPPRISYMVLMDRGEHIGSGALPGTKYWAHQNGSTQEMHLRNIEDVFVERPEFVVVDRDNKKLIDRLEQSGYEHVLNYSLDGETADSLKTNSLLFLSSAH